MEQTANLILLSVLGRSGNGVRSTDLASDRNGRGLLGGSGDGGSLCGACTSGTVDNTALADGGTQVFASFSALVHDLDGLRNDGLEVGSGSLSERSLDNFHRVQNASLCHVDVQSTLERILDLEEVLVHASANELDCIDEVFAKTGHRNSDALTDVFTKGKVGWSSLEQTILSGITRIIVEQQLIRPIAQYLQGGAGGDGIVGALGSVLGSVLGGGSGGSGFPDSLPTRGGRAAGGPVERGGLYEINETRRGPGEVLNVGGRQYLMALQAGYVQPVVPTPAAGQGRVLHQTNNFHVSGAVDRRTQQQLAMQAGRQAQTALNRNG